MIAKHREESVAEGRLGLVDGWLRQLPDDTIKQNKRDEPKVGRNDPCPCGSGKKYKKCHGA